MRFKKMFIPSEGRSNYTKQGDINSTIINSGNYGGGGGFIDFTPDIENLKDKDENLEGRLKTVETNLGEPSTDPNKSKVDGTAFERIQYNKNLIGNSTDDVTKGSLWGAVNGMEEEIYGDGTEEGKKGILQEWEAFETNWSGEVRRIGNDLGKPTDDGTTPGQNETAFGRIAALENGKTVDGYVNSEIIKDSSFVINSPYNDQNKKAFALVQKYMFTQNTWEQDGHIKENLPLWVRDYNTFDAYNVIQIYPEYTEDEHHNYTLTLLTLSFIKTENGVDYEYKYSFNKEGKATQVSKVEVHKDTTQIETNISKLNDNLYKTCFEIRKEDSKKHNIEVFKYIENIILNNNNGTITQLPIYVKDSSDLYYPAITVWPHTLPIYNPTQMDYLELTYIRRETFANYNEFRNLIRFHPDGTYEELDSTLVHSDGALGSRIAAVENSLTTNLGTKEDDKTKDTAFGRIQKNKEDIAYNYDWISRLSESTIKLDASVKGMEEEIYGDGTETGKKGILEEWQVFEQDWSSELRRIGNDLGKPTDDGETAGQIDTAFGRIKKLENGEGGGLATLSPVVEKNTFYLNANSSFSSKEKNVTTYKNMIHYVSQKPKCQVPIYIRPDEDYEGTWNAILVNPHKIDHMKWDGVDVTYCKPDYDGDKKYYLYQVFISQDGSVTDKGKIDIEGGGSLTPEELQALYNRIYNIEEKIGWQDENLDAMDYQIKELQEKIPQYNIRLRRKTREGSVDKPYYALTSQIDCIIENYDDDIKNNPNDYRICLMLFKKKNKKNHQTSTVYNTSRQWRVPMLADVWDPDTGTQIEGCSQAMRFPWNWTFVNIKGVETPMYGGLIDLGGGSYQQRITLDYILNMKKPDPSIAYLGAIDELSHQFRNNHNRKYDVGWAIFKKTRVKRMVDGVEQEVLVGQKGWTRVSNIAKMQLFCTRANFVQVKVMP